jgi:HPt (histidine-containing phosphotransfer) domain-containing protein
MFRAFAVFMLSLLVSTPAFASEFAAGVVEPYLEIHSALAADRTEGVARRAETIASAAARLGPEAAPIVQAARQLQDAGTIATSRDAFAKLTDAVTRYAKATGTTMGVRLTYCPMEKRHWLQRDGTVANPYAGGKMPRCGEFKDQL